MKIIIIDNYDSFTYNLAHLVKELGHNVTVWRNDQFEMASLASYDRIILSPGPGVPSEAGLLTDVIRFYAGEIPMLGICLGHQAIGEVFGASLTNLSKVYHGVQTPCRVNTDDPLFEGFPEEILIGRYHSWVVSRNGLPACLEVIAESEDGQIMALRHREYNIYGVQFHPESVLTPDGKKLMANWLKIR